MNWYEYICGEFSSTWFDIASSRITKGRVSLAQAMVEPIRRALEYQAVGRLLLPPEELPHGAFSSYEMDVRANSSIQVVSA